ncbi:hypothetical protein BKA70DRAFT_1324114 [Coprinopsis sp. MPI-PUGE-AT-0042]|nr:hypothetical protein BKA70DRAFT_1324114 [Coprinopsis sp. MPI-PUGE-AT-0042]
MGKKNANAAAKAAKKAKAQLKVERKEKKKVLKETGSIPAQQKKKGKGGKKGRGGGGKDDEDSDDDLEGILEKMRKEHEAAHLVTEELVAGPPSRRANATLTPCPNGGHLWSIGGEWFSEDGKAHFYNDVFRYTPEKDEWRKFVTPTCPGPRSAHAVCSSPAGGGKLFLFGGEFSSLHQNSFHHYGDFWCFDVTSHTWDRIETKVRPSARSGHRMAMWKHFVVLFGGFYDPGVTTRYLNDLWIFDTQEYVWKQVEFRETELKPSPRSGFSFLPCAEGIILHGGYCKQYAKGKRPVGVMLEDTWLLKLALPETSGATPATPSTPSTSTASSSKKAKGGATTAGGGWGKGPAVPLGLTAKWERRKRPSDAFAPSLRSGCTMALWQAKNMGVMFGGVTDEDTSEETLESVFHNDMFGYQITGKGRWVSLGLKIPKAKGGKKKQKKGGGGRGEDYDSDDEWRQTPLTPAAPETAQPTPQEAQEVEDPNMTIPTQRYNTMLAVLKNNLYIYGGIFEKGPKEYTLDDFHSIQLDKLERFTCLRRLSFEIPTGEDEESSEDEDDEDDEDNSDDEEDESDEEDEEEEWEGKYDTYPTGDDDEVTVVGEDDGVEEEGKEDVIEEIKPKKKKKVKVDDEGEGDDQDEDKEERRRRRREKKEKKLAKAAAAAAVDDQADIVPAEDEDTLDQVEEAEEEPELRQEARKFLTSSNDAAARSAEEAMSTPIPGETLALFYARSRDYWTQRAAQDDREGENRGKELRRVGFALAEERYDAYKPLLAEVEKILAEAGLNEEEMRMSAQSGGTQGSGGGISRNRR